MNQQINNNDTEEIDWSYKGNGNLTRVGYKHEFTQHEIEEYIKCKNDPIYFIENYVYVVHPDRGKVLFKMFDYQKDMIRSYCGNRRTVSLTGRQLGKTITAAAFFCWFVCFNEDKSAGILANKASTARAIMSRFQLAYELLPRFLKQNVKTWNKGSIELENGCKVLTSGTSASGIRGESLQLLYLDEWAFVPTNLADDFFTSVFPTLSASKESKVIVTSTPKGFNHFYKLWNDAVQGTNGYNPIFVDWKSHPERDEKWFKSELSALGEEKFEQEHCASFIGSSNTLIKGLYIKNMSPDMPRIAGEMRIYEEPKKDHEYVLVCDPARGTGNDSSAFIIFDITNYPIKICACYNDPDISPLALPYILNQYGQKYNDAYILVEINDNGQQIADLLWYDFEYENMVSTRNQLTKKSNIGVRTTKSVKSKGCSNFKDIIESQKMIVNDLELIREIAAFVQKKNSYEADEGHDDLVMCCVLLSWLLTTKEFRDLSNKDYRAEIMKQKVESIEEDMLPFGIIDNGLDFLDNNNNTMINF